MYSYGRTGLGAKLKCLYKEEFTLFVLAVGDGGRFSVWFVTMDYECNLYYSFFSLLSLLLLFSVPALSIYISSSFSSPSS